MSDDERAIREVVDTWMKASMAGDTATVLTLVADDVVFLGPGHRPFGKEAFRAAQNGLGDMRLEGHAEVREVRVSGDWAFCWTDLKVAMTPAGGATVRRSGNTLTVFQRLADGRWVLARDANMLSLDEG